MIEFSVGDVVRLKSGGPLMTVVDTSPCYEPPYGPDVLRTNWFDDHNILMTGLWSRNMLDRWVKVVDAMTWVPANLRVG